MSWVQAEADFTTWFIEGTFIAATIFAILYGCKFAWRDTITGRAILTLDLCIAGSLLHSTLLAWHFTSLSIKPGLVQTHMSLMNNVLNWVGTASLGGAGLAIIWLTWEAVRWLYGERCSRFRAMNWLLRLGNGN